MFSGFVSVIQFDRVYEVLRPFGFSTADDITGWIDDARGAGTGHFLRAGVINGHDPHSSGPGLHSEVGFMVLPHKFRPRASIATAVDRMENDVRTHG